MSLPVSIGLFTDGSQRLHICRLADGGLLLGYNDEAPRPVVSGLQQLDTWDFMTNANGYTFLLETATRGYSFTLMECETESARVIIFTTETGEQERANRMSCVGHCPTKAMMEALRPTAILDGQLLLADFQYSALLTRMAHERVSCLQRTHSFGWQRKKRTSPCLGRINTGGNRQHVMVLRQKDELCIFDLWTPFSPRFQAWLETENVT